MAKSKSELVEVDYSCSCGNAQTVRFFPNDHIYPALCCVRCQAGFGSQLTYGQMAANGIGMIAGKPVNAGE